MFGISTKKIAVIDVPDAIANKGGKVTIDIPNDYNVAAIQLRVVSGAVTVGTAAALAVQAGGAANLFSNIRLSSRDDSRWDLSGWETQVINRLHMQGSVTQVDPLLTTGDKTFELCISRRFQMPRMLVPVNNRGILPCRLVRDMQLQLQLAAPTAILQPDTTTTLVYKAGTQIEVTIQQAVDSPDALDFYLNEQLFSKTYPTQLISTGEQEIKLETSGKYRHFVLYAMKRVSGLWTLDDSLVNNVKLYSSRSEIIDQSWKSLQEENIENFLLPAKITGVAVLDYTRFASPSELLPADEMAAGGSSLYLKPNCATSAADSLFGIIGVRLWDNARLPLIPKQ